MLRAPFVAFLMFILPHLAAQVLNSATVQGTVKYADTGKPASGINLWLEPAQHPRSAFPDPKTGDYEIRDSDSQPERYPAKVGADGAFGVTGLPPGDYIVHTYAPPYLSPDGTVYPVSNTTHIATGPQVEPSALHAKAIAGQTTKVAVRLHRGGAIEGTLKQSDGSLVASDIRPPYGVAVNAALKIGTNIYARSGGAAHTDANWHYRLEGLAPGNYIVFAASMGPMVPTATGRIASGNLPLFAPGTSRADSAVIIHIAGSETARADFIFPPATALHRVEGSVTVNEQGALKQVIVRLFPKGEGGITASAPLRADTGFSFDGIPDGTYTLTIEFPARPEYVSVDRERGIVHMRMHPPLYAPLSRDITIAGQDLSGILLHPAAAAQDR